MRFGAGLFAASLCLLVAKAAIAAHLDLFGDGAWYWLESQRLAAGYSDLPPGIALAIAASTALFGQSVLGIKVLLLLVITPLPFVVYRWAARLTGEPDARWAGAFTLVLPMAATLGLMAIPDVLLVALGMAAIIALERALSGSHTRGWLLAGFLLGAGFVVHYRWAVVPLGAVAYFLTSPRGRRLLRTPGPWLAALAAIPGLVPLAWYNMTHDYAGVAFQFVDRHPWQWHGAPLQFWLDQVLTVTPVLYGLVVFSALANLGARKAADDRPYLLAMFGLTHILLFGLAAPWADQQRTSVHWPLLGYIPLFVYLPSTLRAVTRHARGLLVVALISSAVGCVAVIGYFGLMTRYGELSEEVRGPLVAKMSGHAAQVQELERRLGDASAIVVDDYYLAAQVEFHLDAQLPVFALSEEKAANAGRLRQLRVWQRTFHDIDPSVHTPALLVIDRMAWSDDQFDDLLAQPCTLWSRVTELGSWSLFEGERRFYYYRMEGAVPAPALPTHPAAECRPRPRLYVDRGYPNRIETSAGSRAIEGWAYQDDGGVSHVTLTIDGKAMQDAHYGELRPDVRAYFTDSTDPNHPRVGFSVSWDPGLLAPGWHDIALVVTSHNGNRARLMERRFRVDR